LKALEFANDIQIANKTATIYTDSQTTLDMLKNSKIHSNIIEDIRREWYEMKKVGWQITLRWVKAHAGMESNELEDILPKGQRRKEQSLKFTQEYQKACC